MTNKDYLRTCSDDELSHLLCNLYYDCNDCAVYQLCSFDTENNGFKKWLTHKYENITQ